MIFRNVLRRAQTHSVPLCLRNLLAYDIKSTAIRDRFRSW